jgi:hypothetical protein
MPIGTITTITTAAAEATTITNTDVRSTIP